MTGALKITLRSAKAQRALHRAPDIYVEEMTAAVTEGSLLLEREVKERTPTSGAGTLRESIGALPVTISEASVAGGVGTSIAHALPVELGSRPHWAPIEPLEDWVRRKLGLRGEEAKQVARGVRFKIAKKGTKGAFMFRDGSKATEPQILSIFEGAADRANARIEELGR
jgi:hypothetical protein